MSVKIMGENLVHKQVHTQIEVPGPDPGPGPGPGLGPTNQILITNLNPSPSPMIDHNLSPSPGNVHNQANVRILTDKRITRLTGPKRLGSRPKNVGTDENDKIPF